MKETHNLVMQLYRSDTSQTYQENNHKHLELQGIKSEQVKQITIIAKENENIDHENNVCM